MPAKKTKKTKKKAQPSPDPDASIRKVQIHMSEDEYLFLKADAKRNLRKLSAHFRWILGKYKSSIGGE